jgi:hypothetical protein
VRAVLGALSGQEDDVIAARERSRVPWRWLLGALIGGIAGIGPLGLGTPGVVLVLPVLVWAFADRPRGHAFGGTLVEVSITWLVVWGRLVQTCGTSTATDG